MQRYRYSLICLFFVVMHSRTFAIIHLHSCPHGNLWHRRASQLCIKKEWYHCLLDTNSVNSDDPFVEKCLKPRRYFGKKYVFSGNVDALDCSESSFTPKPTWSYSTRNSECTILKSLCNEKGQVVVDRGSTKTDRACRCNYRQGYNYVIRPKNLCRCYPLKEDCSCYTHKCPESMQILSPDYKCVEKDVLQFYECDEITKQRGKSHKNTAKDNRKSDSQATDNTSSNHHDNDVKLVVVVSISLTVIIVGVSVLMKMIVSNKVPSITIEIPMIVSRGDSLELKLRINSSLQLGQVCWYHLKHDNKWSGIDYNSSSKHEGTVEIFPSLRINDVNISDSGLYRCTIRFQNNTVTSCTKELKVPEEILIKNMPVVLHYQPTKQLQEIKDAFSRHTRLVVLQGLHGSGKTQAAHKYCMEIKNEYSIVGNIHLKKNLKFKETLERFAIDELKIKVSYEPKVDTQVIIKDIKHYLNNEDRSGFPYILLVDNIDADTLDEYNDINLFVSLLQDVPTLKIILATTDQKVVENLSWSDYRLIKFQGMDKEEIFSLFADIRTTEEDINKLVAVTGNIPLVLISAIRHILTSKMSLNSYVENFPKISNFLFQSKEGAHNETTLKYNESLINSQLMPLTFMKESLNDKEWEVVIMMPFFSYDSVSTTLLEACYYHQTKCSLSEKVSSINKIVEAFTKVSLCQIESFSLPRISGPFSSSGPNKNGSTIAPQHLEKNLSFHKITMKALDVIRKNDTEDKNNDRLLFLLKMFCSEIDIDARSDETVARNLLFVHHANKIYKIAEKERKNALKSIDIKELNFIFSFIHCAIGSTLLFERTDIELAHTHLMTARRLVLDIVHEESIFATKNCVYIQEAKHVPAAKISEKTYAKQVISKFFDIHYSEEFVKDFVLSKRRNRNDIDVIKKELDNNEKLELFETNYISEKDYRLMCSKKLAQSTEAISRLLFPELIMRIVHNNGQALDELLYIVKNDDQPTASECLKTAISIEFKNAKNVRNEINNRCLKNFPLFVCKQNELNGKMLMRWVQEEITIKEIDEDILFYEKIHNERTVACYAFGVVKMTEKTDLRLRCLCLRIMLRYKMRKYKTETDLGSRNSIYDKCKSVMQELCKKLEKVELIHKDHTWLSLPLLYIQCGKCLLLSQDSSDTNDALKYFDHALSIEESRGAYWTRFVYWGYKGKVSCLRKLGEASKAIQIINKVISILEGKNRDQILNQFKDIKAQIKFDV